MKWDPVNVSLEMEMITSNGNFVFTSEECLSAPQIKSYFSRLAAKQRSTKTAVDQQQSTSSSTTASSLTTTTITNVNSQGNSQLTAQESFDNDDETDERDLDAYVWRQALDEARVILDHSSNSSTQLTTSSISSNSTSSGKRKSTKHTSQINKHKNK